MTKFTVEAANLKTLYECRGSGATAIMFNAEEGKR
jgi:hypothetical protein